MKKEFLTNFKVNGQPLPDEVVEAILAENGRDLAAFADHETIKQQLAEAQKTIKGFEGQDIEGVRKAAKDWEDKYNQAVAEHNQKMADMAFDHALEAAITGMKGRNAKGIRANLDLEALKASKNQEADIKTALTDIIFPECSCTRAIELYKAVGRFAQDKDYVPQPGDFLIYDWQDNGDPDHWSTVVRVTGTTIRTIEGNMDNRVWHRDVEIGDERIYGYCLPDYAIMAGETGFTDVPETTPGMQNLWTTASSRA